MNKNNVINYYEKSLADYQLIYFRNNNYSMNYGYWDKTITNRNDSLLKLNAVIAKKLKLTKKDYVLDAGCGFGAITLWLANHIGSKVEGISIAPNQIKKAKILAKKQGLNSMVNFRTINYTKTPYPNNHFDSIFAIETICHLHNKAHFYQEMYRILKPNGKLLVTEYILNNPQMNNIDKNEMKLMLDGWAIPNLWTKKQHLKTMESLGFSNVSFEDYSDKTVKTSLFLYRHSIYSIPIYRILHKIGLLSGIRLKNALSCKYQWITKQKGLWGHGLIFGEKPKSK